MLREKIKDDKIKMIVEKLLKEGVEISNMLGASVITMKNKK